MTGNPEGAEPDQQQKTEPSHVRGTENDGEQADNLGISEEDEDQSFQDGHAFITQKESEEISPQEDNVKQVVLENFDPLTKQENTKADDSFVFKENKVEATNTFLTEIETSEEQQIEVKEEKETSAEREADQNNKDDTEIQEINNNRENISPNTDMPERSEAVPQSPTLQRACCRYRWAQTIPTSASEILFFLSLRKDDGIKLTWTESSSCYYSEELDIPIGVYNGELVVDGKTYPVEDINIKHYTFEADIFVKDDHLCTMMKRRNAVNKDLATDETDHNLLEETQEKEQIIPNETSLAEYQIKKMEEPPIHLSNKYEELVRQQLSQKALDLCVEDRLSRSQKSDHSSGRHTPIGDVDVEPYQDGDINSVKSGKLISVSGDSLNNSLVEDEVERSSLDRSKSAPQDLIQDFLGNDPHKTPAKLSGGPAQQMTSELDLYDPVEFEERKNPLRLSENFLNGSVSIKDELVVSPNQSVHNSLNQTPTVDDVLEKMGSVKSGQNSGHSSTRHTPQSHLVSDVLNQQQQSSPARSEHSSSQHGSTRQTSQPPSEHSSARQTPVSHRELISDALRLSQERLYGSQASLGHQSGSGGSRPVSLTSEQELTQYFEQNSRPLSDRSSTKQTTGKIPSPLIDRNSVQSTSSLPVITTQQRLQAEKRSMTPENHVRVPGAGSPVGRSSSAANRSAASSRTSTRTLTPVSANGVLESGQREEAQLQRIQDLEDSVRNLRKLLSSREMEVHELTKQLNDFKDINKSLRQELEHVRSRKSPSSHYAELEHKNKQLLEEKEILSAEVVKLQDLVDELRKGRDVILEGGIDGESSSIRHYDPNNPEALQKKIAALESHIQDLQEANESAMTEVSLSERKIQTLIEENGNLKKTPRGVNVAELESENKRLHDKISKLYEEGYGDTDHRIRVESQQLRDDNRALRERNYKLHEENLKFKEELTELRRALERSSVKSTSQRDETSARMLNLGLSSSRLEMERSMESKLASERKDKLSSSEKLLSSREYLNREDNKRIRPTLDKEDSKYRSSEHDYRSPIDRGIERLKAASSFHREDKEFRDSLDKKDSKYSYDSYERSEPRHDKDLEKSMLDRSFERMRYEYEELGGSAGRSDSYRTRPDGGSVGEKDHLSSNLKYDKPVDRTSLYDSELLGTDRLKHDKYGKDLYSTDTSRRLSLERDYQVYQEPRRESRSGDRHRDGSRSVTDFNRSSRGRTRSCSDSYQGTSSYLPTPLQSIYHPSRYRSNLSRLPKPSFLWDDKEQRRPGSSASDKVESTSANRSSDRFSKTSPAAYSSSSYRASELYDRDLGKSYNSHGKPPVPAYMDDPGEVSDTATDILVNAHPFEKLSQTDPYSSSSHRYDDHHQHYHQDHHPDHQSRHQHHYSERQPTHSRYGYRRRREIASAAGADSSPSDVEDQYDIYSPHQRSKSADGRELRGSRSAPLGGISRTNTGMSGTSRTDDGMRLSLDSGFRSITPSILKTQHNKNLLTTTSGSLQNLTSGMKPFAPRTPGDVNIEDVVKFSRQGGKLSQGTVKYIGHLPGRSDVYLGIELDKEDGKHDGKFEGNRYFRCKPSKGVFVAFNKVVMAWSPF